MARFLFSLVATVLLIKLGGLLVTTKYLLLAVGILCAALISLSDYAVWTRFKGSR